MGFLGRLSPPVLYVLSAMVFWGQMQNYIMRGTFKLTITAMSKDPVKNGSATANFDNPCLANKSLEVSEENAPSAQQEFEWDAIDRAILISALTYGYTTTQILGGRMSEKFGVKRVYGLFMFASAILSLLSPLVAKWSVTAFSALRVLQGVCTGVSFPSLHAMTARWVPPEERSRFIARSYFGSVFGLFVGLPVTGILIENFGWEWAFYFAGGLTCLWFVFWWLLVFDNPESHPRISSEEKNRILSAIKKNVDLEKKARKTPWKSILTSPGIWGIFITDSCNCYGIVTLSHGTFYLNYLLGVDIRTNGMLSALPWLMRYIGGVLTSYLTDLIIKKSIVSVVNARRIANSMSQVMQ